MLSFVTFSRCYFIFLAANGTSLLNIAPFPVWVIFPFQLLTIRQSHTLTATVVPLAGMAGFYLKFLAASSAILYHLFTSST
jgi:hypothetical protein